MTDLPPRGLPPLDASTAQARARQISVIADPLRLRILSIMATRPAEQHSSSSLAAELDVGVETITGHLEELRTVDLVTTVPAEGAPAYSPSPEAWVRFGRLLTGKSSYQEPVQAAGAASTVGLPDAIQRVAERLAYRFSSHFSRETVERYVAESYVLLSTRASVSRHLPSLTSRFATDRLGALAAAKGFDLRGTPEVLFVCVQNSGRSQMAAGLLRQLAGDRVHVRTAGSQPAESIDPVVVDILDEIGVPIVAEFPKPLTDEVVQAADIVITMGCGDACPVYPGRMYMDWPIEDPIGKPLEQMRVIRDEIQQRVESLLRGLRLA
ncbi:three-helix bundle dimerization domain-containing protein [Herbiconiux sp.]|uniref:arsenate reductase/protein-tyrosine-phosphatase family protein n=1 Tax=Herbiconiux sp. TaxID=1871186 RepID=UPI0025BD3288|nr:helix-turn-helix domain-containing protein [Herbiconiux sp.]